MKIAFVKPLIFVQGASTTAAHADQMADKQTLRIKHSFNRNSTSAFVWRFICWLIAYIDSLAKIIVYSIALDGPIRDSDDASAAQPNGFLAGSRALDSLDKLITSTESYFHPSNSGHWTFSVGSRGTPPIALLTRGNSSPTLFNDLQLSSASVGWKNNSRIVRRLWYAFRIYSTRHGC